jgi:hypothetical protein
VDVVYVMARQARSGSSTAELRYSLRTLTNLPHDRVFISGWTPDWTTNVVSVETRQGKTKWQNALDNLTAVLDDVSDEFVLMNDDFFIMEPFERIPVLHRGPIGESNRSSGYQKARNSVKAFLVEQGVAEPLSYELHIPFVYNRHLLKEALDRAEGRLVAGYQRTLYGNLHRIGGEFMDDCKVTSNSQNLDTPFLSTNESSFRSGNAGKLIREQFAEPSPYER